MNDSYWIDILKKNTGFNNPEKWVEYARSHSFSHVEARKVLSCPDCGETGYGEIGQYVYYSTLISLHECLSCGLIYANSRIDPQVIQKHFERAYKNEEYFVQQREAIFQQIASLIDALSPKNATVLDIGGAKGHLLARLRDGRPDIEATLNDVSKDACLWAESQYKLDVIIGSAADVTPPPEGFDTVTIIDALYYEPNISKLFQQVPNLVKTNGHLIMRLPNLGLLIKLCQRARKVCSIVSPQTACDRISLFNPEHLYIFTRKYLVRRLYGLGFKDVKFIPSALLLGGKRTFLYQSCSVLGKLLEALSSGHVIATPSVIVVGTRK